MAKPKKVRIAPFGTFTTGKKTRCDIEKGVSTETIAEQLAIKALSGDGITPRDLAAREPQGPRPHYQDSISERVIKT